MKKSILALAAVASMFASSAFAQVYIGGAAGQGHTNLDCTGASSCSNSGTGYKVFGGYRFANNFAGEVSYFDFGKASASGGGASLNLRSTAFGLGGAFLVDFTPQWNGAVRLGLASVKMKGDATLLGASGSTSETSTQAYVGFGVGYAVTKSLSITGTIDLSRAKIVGETGNVRLLSVGLTQSF